MDVIIGDNDFDLDAFLLFWKVKRLKGNKY